MNKITHFSKHAIKRIELRSQLTLPEIAQILDEGQFVDTGCEPGFNRHHLLYYSQKDDDFFVAIQDRFIGKVITLLPLEYHQLLAWRVTESQCIEAQNKAESMKSSQPITPLTPVTEATPPKKSGTIGRVRINALYLDNENKQKAKELSAEASDLYNQQLLSLKKGLNVMVHLREVISKSGIDPKSVYGLSARHSKKGFPHFIEVQMS